VEHFALVWQIAITVPVIHHRPQVLGLHQVAARREIREAVFADIVCGGGGVEPVPLLPPIAVDLLEDHYPRAAHRVAIFVYDAAGDHTLRGQADLGIHGMVVLTEDDGAANCVIEESGTTCG
jgi:hypothetical protein